MTLHLERSRAYPVTVEHAWHVVLPTPLDQVFTRWFGPLPPVREVRDQVGEWGTVGQTRTIVLADRGTMREELTVVEPHERFGYRISDVTGPMKAFAAAVDGTWTFAPAGTGVRVTWAWTVHPAPYAGLTMPVFGRLWHGYAGLALERIETLLLPRPPG